MTRTNHPSAREAPRPRAVAMAGVVAVVFFGVSMLPTGTAQSAQEEFWNSPERTFFLHLAQYCDREVSLIRWVDEFDWPNDLDGCGGNVLDPTTTQWTDVFPSFAPLHANVTGQTSAEMHIFILSRAVDQTTVEATFDVGYASCTGSDGPEVLVQEMAGGYHEFVIPCTFQVSGTPDSRARANLTITVTSTYTYGYGTEDEHASFLRLTGVEPAPPTEKVEFFAEGSRPEAVFDDDELEFAEFQSNDTAESPGAGTIVSIVALAAVAASVAARRRA